MLDYPSEPPRGHACLHEWVFDGGCGIVFPVFFKLLRTSRALHPDDFHYVFQCQNV